MKIKKVIKMTVVFVSSCFFMIGGLALAGQSGDRTEGKDVRKEVKEAIEAIGSYSTEQRDEALKKVRIAIDDLDRRINDLNTRIEEKWGQMDQAAREKSQATLKSLREMRNELAEWYGGMQHSSTNAWERVKKGFLDSYQRLSNAFDKALNEF